MASDLSNFSSAYAFFTGHRGAATVPSGGASTIPSAPMPAPAPAPTMSADAYNGEVARLEQQIATLRDQLMAAIHAAPAQTPASPQPAYATPPYVAPVYSAASVSSPASSQATNGIERFAQDAQRLGDQLNRNLPQVQQQVTNVVAGVSNLVQTFSGLFGGKH